MEVLTAADMQGFFSRLAEVMEEKKDWLARLDAELGDGDLGLTMSRGFAAAAESLEELEEEDLGKIFLAAGSTIARKAPSTMGTLLATGFMKSAKTLQGKTEARLGDIAEMMKAFVEGIEARGKAKIGEKTLLDSLGPAADALKRAAETDVSLKEAMDLAAHAAIQGFEATKGMIAQHGRGAYYQEGSVGKKDPGAGAAMLLIRAFADFLAR
jgi:dihydroxyacetone kinase-like protein